MWLFYIFFRRCPCEKMPFKQNVLYITRTAGAAGPLVLESDGPDFFKPQIIPQTTTTNHSYNQRVNIYYYTKKFQSNNFSILPKMLPQTTTTNHYHNQGVNIYYHTNFCSNLTMFKFYHKFYHNHKFYHKPLPLSSSTPHAVFCT